MLRAEERSPGSYDETGRVSAGRKVKSRFDRSLVPVVSAPIAPPDRTADCNQLVIEKQSDSARRGENRNGELKKSAESFSRQFSTP